MANQNHRSAKLRKAYIEQGLTLREAAQYAGLSYAVALAIKKRDRLRGHNWAYKRQANKQAPKKRRDRVQASTPPPPKAPKAPSPAKTPQQVLSAVVSPSGLQSVTRGLLEDFVAVFQQTLANLKSDPTLSPREQAELISRLSVAYQKTVKAAGATDPDLNRLGVALELLEHQREFILQHHPEHVEAFRAILEPFGAFLAAQWG